MVDAVNGVTHEDSPDWIGWPGGNGLGSVVEQVAYPFDFVRCPAAAVHVQGMAQVADRFVDFWRAVVATQGALADFDAHAHAIQGDGLIGQCVSAGSGDGVQAFAAMHLATDQFGFFEEIEGGVDHPGARRVIAIEQVLDLADQVIAVARLFGQHRQHQQLEVTWGEYPRATLATGGAAVKRVMCGVVTH